MAARLQGATATAVESLPFDGDVVAHNPATGALCILNGTAGELLSLMQAGHSEPAVADLLAARYQVARRRVAADLASLRTAWCEAGLLGEPPAAPPSQAAAPAPEPPALAAPPLDATVSCGGRALRLRCEEATLAALLGAVLRPALSEAAPAAGTIELAGEDGAYRCWLDGRHLWSCGPRPLARRNLLREAIVRTLPGPPAALLHASAVAIDGRAVVLAGDSGTGKTTLAAALVGQGALLIADDLLPLLPDGGLPPVPLALSLKAGSWPLLGRLFPAVGQLAVLQSRGLKVRYLWPGGERAAAAPLPPAAILFPAHRRGAAPQRQALSPRQCLERLIDSGTRLETGPGALRALTRLAEETPAFALAYDRVEDGSEAVTAILRVL